jgi:hypothetical protein
MSSSYPYNGVFVAASPRTGSMWAWNVCCDILQLQGLPLCRSDGIAADVGGFDAVVAGERLPAIVCCHSHEQYPYAEPVRIISLVRDIRDVILSAMRFGTCNFDKALYDVTHWAVLMDYYRDYPNALIIRYEQMIADYPEAIRRIAAHLALPVTAAEVERIASTYAPERVSKIVNVIEAEFYERYAEDAEVLDFREDRFSFLTDRNLNGSIRVIDKVTRFQSNHISGRGPGEWRTVFSPEQIERVETMFGDWLITHGYRDP